MSLPVFLCRYNRKEYKKVLNNVKEHRKMKKKDRKYKIFIVYSIYGKDNLL